MRIHIPDSLLGIDIALPFEQGKQVHSKESATLGLHRMFGCSDHQPDRVVRVEKHGEGYKVILFESRKPTEIDIPFVQLVAGMSFLEGHVLKGALRQVKSLGELEYRVLEGTQKAAARKIMNSWDKDTNPSPWTGVGIIPTSPDGEEFAFAKKDHLHPRAGYCHRLAVIGGGMDPNEILSDWGSEAETAYVAMLRESFEEVRRVNIARQLAEAAAYHGPCATSCYLYEDSGQPTAGTLRLFVARAPSSEIWDTWRRIFTKEEDGLGEANPVLVTRAELREAFAQEAAANDARIAKLAITAPELIAEEAKASVQRFSKRFAGSDAEWLRRREEARDQGLFPLVERGNFAFIAGAGGPIHRALVHEGIF